MQFNLYFRKSLTNIFKLSSVTQPTNVQSKRAKKKSVNSGKSLKDIAICHSLNLSFLNNVIPSNSSIKVLVSTKHLLSFFKFSNSIEV